MAFCCKCVVEVVGAVVLALLVLKVLRWLRLNLFVKTNCKAKYGKSGDWAVITGASAGIGEGFAVELARRGFNVCVIARRKQVLEELCREIETKYKVLTKAVSFDFATTDDAEYSKLFQQLGALSISVLVNNVGLSYPNYQPFGGRPPQAEVDMLTVNCQSVLRMTQFVLPRMREHRAGAVITVSSTYGSVPAPMLGPYGATKAFGRHFSYSMGVENQEQGIDFLAVSPMFVFTAMAKAKKPTAMMVMPRDVASGALDRLGHTFETVGTVKQELIFAVLSALPQFFSDKMALDQSKDLHRRWVKKSEAEAAAAAGGAAPAAASPASPTAAASGRKGAATRKKRSRRLRPAASVIALLHRNNVRKNET